MTAGARGEINEYPTISNIARPGNVHVRHICYIQLQHSHEANHSDTIAELAAILALTTSQQRRRSSLRRFNNTFSRKQCS